MLLATKKQTKTEDTTSQRLLSLVKQHGRFPLSFSSFQKNLEYFSYENIGFVAYAKTGKTVFVLGDPVAPREKLREIVNSFHKKFPYAVWVQIHRETAMILNETDYVLSPLGIESTMSLPYSLSGKSKADIRVLSNSAKYQNLEVREIDYSQAETRQFKDKDRYSFLVATEMRQRFSEVRYIGGFIKGTMTGYSLFHPFYSNNKIIGYHEILPFRCPNSPKGSRVQILLKAMEQFAKEGVQSLSIGLSPLKNKKSTEATADLCQETKLQDYIFGLIYNYGNFFFNFQGLAFHKSRFRGDEVETYIASKNKYMFIDYARLYRLITGRWIPSRKTN